MSTVEDMKDGGVRVPPVLVEAPVVGEEERGRRSKYSEAAAVRVWPGFILGVCGSMLGMGAWMTPSVKGYGTHSENLGLPACGFLQMTGYPCPTCGCTTAVTHVAHGHLLTAIWTQPFGAAVGLLAVILCAFAVVGLWKGKWFGPRPFWVGYHWKSVALGTAAVFLLGWGWKVLAMRNGW